MTDLRETTLRWVIKNFDMCTQLPGYHIKSPTFSINIFKSINFYLCLYSRGRTDEYGSHISLSLLRQQDDGPETISLKYEIGLVNTQASLTDVKKIDERKFTKYNGYCTDDFYERDLLFKLKDNVFRRNTLTVECRLIPINYSECSNDEKEIEVYTEEVRKDLSSDVAKILENKVHSDMTLLIEGEKFSVHKAILQCRCPKLMAHVKNTTSPNVCTLSGIDTNDLRQLLYYLYSGILRAGCVSNGILTACRTYRLPELSNAFPFAYRVTAITDIDVIRSSFKWVIENIGDLQENEELVYNPFYNEDLKKRLQIVLTIKHSDNESNEVLLNFRRIRMDIALFFRCKITIGDYKKAPNTVKEFAHIFKIEKEWETSLCSDALLKESLQNDTLNLFFEISVSNGEKSSKIEKISYEAKSEKIGEESVKNLKLLQKDLRSLYNNPMFSDVTLSVGDTKLPAHKSILCGRSRVFARMFEHNMVKTQKGIIVIDDIDLPTVSSMLLFIYCGFIKTLNVSKAINLYAAADKYELLILKEQCSGFLKSNLNSNNIGEILLLADAHHDESLKECVYNFITCNSEEMTNSENFLSTLNGRMDVYPDVLKCLLQHITILKCKLNS